jgi:SRSO17 transposase
MVSRTSDWRDELGRWLKPFLDRLGHKARRQMCPLYVSGLIGPGDRKSIQPMAERLALGEYDQLRLDSGGGFGLAANRSYAARTALLP